MIKRYTNQRLLLLTVVGKSQIPLRYLVADRFEAGRGPVADLLLVLVRCYQAR